MAVAAESIIRALGLILSNSSVYGPQHAVSLQSIETCYQILQQAWAEDDVKVSLAEDGLSVNEVPVDTKGTLAGRLADHLAAREIADAKLMRGMKHAQFLAFVEVLEAKPDELQQLGGFRRAINAVGLGSVASSSNRIYRELTEDQTVIDRERLARMTESGSPRDSDGTGPDRDDTGESGTTATTQTLLTWLQGSISDKSNAAAQAVRDISGDAARLAELILNAAEERIATGDGSADLVEATVEALRRAYAAMTDDPSFHTQKTKKQIQRTLELIEQALAEQLSALKLPGDDGRSTLKEAVEEMTDELTVDALAREYTRKHKAIETSERRLIRYVKRKGLDGIEDSELKQRLIESGLEEDGWRDLLARGIPVTGGADAIGASNSPVAATGAITEHLNRLLAEVIPDGPDTPTVSETLLAQKLLPIRAAVEVVVRSALQRIETLVTEVDGPAGGTASERDAGRPRLTRKRLFEILAELGQELCQPLAVITCAVEMMQSGSLGELTALQGEILGTVAESGDKLKTLIDRIIAIAGMPAQNAVNKEIQASLYQ